YWTGWQSLGERPVPGIGGEVDWSDNIAPDAKPSGSGSPYMVDLWNDGTLTGQNAFVWCNGLGTDDSWMQYEWTSAVTIGGFGIHQFRPSGTRQLIGCKDMQYWDGSKWVSLGGYNAITDSIYTVGNPYFKELPKVIKTTKFRLYNLIGYAYPSGQVSNPSVSEWQVFSASGGAPPFTGPNLALDATASHGGGGSGVWGPQRLNNGDKIGTFNDCWTSGSSGQNWIQLDWTKPVTVGSMIVYYTRWRTLTGFTMHSCDVQWWDGSKWQTDQHYDDLDHSNSNKDAYIIMKAPRTTTRLRLSNMITYGGNSNIMIQEWEVFGGSGGGSEGWGAYGAGYHFVNMSLNITIPDDHPLT
ncbi:MAG: hypothetical protein KAJ51_11235, partial [Thermoplasmata archaeon]|nr:hypothetical protein [Thermoplasmata archaeon]